VSAPSTVAGPALSPVFNIFNALGDPNRLRIIARLCDGGPCSTSQVTQVTPVSRQAATKHLLLLEAVGLVSSERHGRERIWRMQQKPLADASDYLAALSQRWDQAIDRLRIYVEGEN
jgi:DNA-binding transcriptional ArsR family regulator